MMTPKIPFWTSVIRVVLGAFLLTVVSNREVAADEPRLKTPTLENSDPNGVIEWTRRVYSNGKWNATPDIAHWRENYYVCVNEGTVHNGMDGPAIVLRSSNLQEWDLVYTTTGAPANGSAVDCKLLALPDRLVVYYVYMNREGGDNYSETRAVYTEDGKKWSASQRVYEPGHNLWKPKLYDGLVYVASDYINAGRDGRVTAADENNPKLFRIDLLRSKDGLTWEKVSTIQKDAPWSITETSLVVRPDGELWAFTRQDFLSRSRPPYKDWTNERAHILGGGIAGPAMIALGDDVYLAGRFYSYLAKHGPPDSPQTNKMATSLLKYKRASGRFESIADLPMPSYADMGYSGFVETKDGVFLVYYSGHAYREANLARGNYTTQTDIYLSKLKIGKPAPK
jgi:hypothetical protein